MQQMTPFLHRVSGTTIFLVILTLSLLAVADKAFNVDEPLFLWTAEQILKVPSDFFGFDVNWYGWKMPMVDVTKNPPLVGYALAIAASVGGWSETWLHALALVPVLAALLGMARLAKSVGTTPWIAGALLFFSPAFLVSGTTVMSDLPMLAFWIWAIVLWKEGIDRSSASRCLAAGLLGAGAMFCKYFGGAVFPLMIVYALLMRARWRIWLPAFALPILLVGAYLLWSWKVYDRLLLGEAAEFTRALRATSNATVFSSLMTGLSFTGGCALTVAAFTPWLWKARHLAVGALIAILIAVLLALYEEIGRFSLVDSEGIRWRIIIQVSFLATIGIGFIWMALDEARRRGPDGILLALWFLGAFVFASFINWTVNGRTILAVIPPIVLIAARRMESMEFRLWSRPRHIVTVAVFALSTAVSLAVLRAEAAWADSARAAAASIDQRYGKSDGTVWFQGHWGFQYYMQKYGARPYDARNPETMPGDLIVLTSNSPHYHRLPPETVELEETIVFRPTIRLATMNRAVGAGFHADVWGPLPFAFGLVPAERYYVFRVIGN